MLWAGISILLGWARAGWYSPLAAIAGAAIYELAVRMPASNRWRSEAGLAISGSEEFLARMIFAAVLCYGGYAAGLGLRRLFAKTDDPFT